GGWYDTAKFADQRFAMNGLPLADPASGEDPRMHRGDYSLYAVADQTVWRARDGSRRRLNAFGRIMGAPADQNAVDFFFNGGLTLKAPLPGRPHDHAGIDFGIGRVSARLADFDRDSGLPVQTTEELVELTYQAQVMRWLTVQPDLQYVINPGAGVLDPADPTHRLRNELVVGARATVAF
ncbi:MAG TPA: carbohydrate porin, partial [Nevskiaceae bacterium]